LPDLTIKRSLWAETAGFAGVKEGLPARGE